MSTRISSFPAESFIWRFALLAPSVLINGIFFSMLRLWPWFKMKFKRSSPVCRPDSFLQANVHVCIFQLLFFSSLILNWYKRRYLSISCSSKQAAISKIWIHLNNKNSKIQVSSFLNSGTGILTSWWNYFLFSKWPYISQTIEFVGPFFLRKNVSVLEINNYELNDTSNIKISYFRHY